MPIVTVEVVAGETGALPHDLARRLADAIGNALGSPPGETWVRLRALAHDQYAENQCPLDASRLPVFVSVLKRQSVQGAELEREAAQLTQAIAHVIGRAPGCVHIEFAPPAAGRLSFGGKVVP